MLDIASHIGAYDTLILCEQFGGRDIYVPVDASKNPLREAVGPAKARKLSWVYRRETLAIPTARHALAVARRAPVLASVRAGDLSVAQAARLLHLRRDYVSKLVARTDEGREAPPLPALSRKRDPRQLDMFDA